MTYLLFTCPGCGTEYADGVDLKSLKIGGFKCDECDFHITVKNVEDVREVSDRVENILSAEEGSSTYSIDYDKEMDQVFVTHTLSIEKGPKAGETYRERILMPAELLNAAAYRLKNEMREGDEE